VSNCFGFKTTGAIVVPRIEDIAVVEGIIKVMNEDEFVGYYPAGLVASADRPWRPTTTYIGKFEIDLVELYQRCKKVGIVISAIEEHTVTTSLDIS